MSRMYRYTTIGIIWILAIFIHYFGIILFAPDATLWGLASDGIGTYIDSDWRPTMYKVFVQYIPLLFVALSLLWGFAAEYEDALLTSRRRIR